MTLDLNQREALARCCATTAYARNTAPFTASALSITVRSREHACTEMFSAKNCASVT